MEQDVLGVVQTEYVVDVSAATPGYGDYQGSTVRVNGLPVYESSHQHDALGRITEWAETVDGTSRVQRFEYDDGGRLLNVRDELDAPVADYGYDLNGNRTHVVEPGRVLDLGVNLGCADSGGVPLARGANDRDELCRHGEYDYTYDANGRLQSRVHVSAPLDETVYTYDGGGRVHQVALGGTTVDYVHDAFGRRVGRMVNGVFERGWLYKDSLNPIAQVDATGTVQATYVYVTRANVPDYIVAASGDVYRVVADHLGSVRMLVNTTTGAITERYDYDVWGRVTFESGDHSLHPFGYAGGLYDADTGLVRFGVRDYDADTGRWTAPEPLGFAAEANWYRYAGGDSVNDIDVDGRTPGPSSQALLLARFLFRSLTTHYYRNLLNHCPSIEPVECNGGGFKDHLGNEWTYDGRPALHGELNTYRGRGQFGGSQCTYDDDGDLHLGEFQGTFDFNRPYDDQGTVDPFGVIGHFITDVLPHIGGLDQYAPTPLGNTY